MSAPKVRKSSPVKQGPMRATIPMASLIRHSTGLRKSPTISPTSGWRTRISPETSSSGQRSPGSITYKGKSKALGCSVGNGNVIRRTASLDAIYLKGQWPIYMHAGLLQLDKATQTEDPGCLKSHRLNSDSSATSTNDDKLEKLIRQRLQRSKDGSTASRERVTAYGLIHQTSTGGLTECTSSQTGSTVSCMVPSPSAVASPVPIPVKAGMVKPPMRSSIEGLNQEIERLVLKGPHTQHTHMDNQQQQVTPEGHRAPLADLLRSTRSVNTQTPATSDVTGSCQSSGPPSRDSASPLIPGQLDVSRPPSEQGSGSSPEGEGEGGGGCRLGTSPHINRFLAREPPDGCERVSLRLVEEHPHHQHTQAGVGVEGVVVGGLKPAFQLRPSQGSAFHPPTQHTQHNNNNTSYR